MTIQLSPEVEALIEKRIQSGVFATPEEVIERALHFLGAEEDWLSENRSEIAAKIQEGWDEAERGDLTDDDQVEAEMQQFEADWLKQRQSA